MTEKEELALVENVELKVGLASTDESFSQLLQSYLAAILLALNSPYNSVRLKVTSLASHLLRRVKSSDLCNVKLPLLKLVDLYKYKDANALVKNFAMVFLQLGISRATPDQVSGDLVAKFAQGVGSMSDTDQTAFLHLLMTLAPLYFQSLNKTAKSSPSNQSLGLESPPISPNAFDKSRASSSSLLNFMSPETQLDSIAILEHLLLVILYQLPVVKAQTALQLGKSKLENQQQSVTPPEEVPGLSPREIARITLNGKAEWTAGAIALTELKVAIAEIAAMNSFFEAAVINCQDAISLRFLILLVGSNDANPQVVKISSDALRKFGPFPIESRLTVTKLQQLYLGDSSQKKQPASISLKLKILQYFGSSTLAANTFPSTMYIVNDSVYQSSDSLENANARRLRRAGLGFLQWTSRMASLQQLEAYAPDLLMSLIDMSSEASAHVDTEAASTALESIGHLAQRLPKLFVGRFDLAIAFMNRLGASAESKLRSSLQDALLCMLPCFSNMSDANNEASKQLVWTHITSKVNSARFVALKYAIEFVSKDPCFSAFTCIVACSDSYLHVSELAQSTVFGDTAVTLSDMVHNLSLLLKLSAYASSVVPNTNLDSGAYGNLLEYLRFLWVRAAAPSFKSERLFEAGILENINARDQITHESLDLDLAKELVKLIENALLFDRGAGVQSLHVRASLFLVELLTLLPHKANDLGSSTILQDSEWFLKLILYKTERSESRLALAQCMSLIFTANTSDINLELVFTEKLIPAVSEKHSKHGAIACLGFLMSHVLHRNPADFQSVLTVNTLKQVMGCLLKGLELNELAEIQIASAAGVSNIALFHSIGEFTDSTGCIEKLENLIKRSEESRVREMAISALSHIAFYSDMATCKSIVSFLFDTCEYTSKHLELCFAVGGALSCIAVGWESLNMTLYDDIPELKGINFPLTRFSGCDTNYIVGQIVGELIPSGKPSARKASCLWIATMLKLTGHLPAMKQQLAKISSSLKGMLVEKDPLLQEAASQSLGLVYDYGDELIKAEVVEDLVRAFSQGTSYSGGQIASMDQNVIDAAVPSASAETGFNNISTYGSIVSLAKETGQPNLVYQLMQLANQSAIWTSRQGASMGFSSILDKAGEALKPHMKNIVPALYCFRFDPNPAVAAAMQQIWSELIPDAATCRPYFDDILKNLLKNTTNPQWRYREAASAGLSELLSQPFFKEKLLNNSVSEETLTALFRNSFQALDDMKESVRVAALKACQTLTNAALSTANPVVYEIIVPFFMGVGLSSKAKEVSQFSLKTLLKICKQKNSNVIAKWLPQLLDCLLESLTEFEPQILNYLTFHASSQVEFEKQRAKAASNGSAPIMEGLEYAIGQLDEDSLARWMPSFLGTIKKGRAGLPTKAACARALVLLYIYKPELMKAHASSCLKALRSALSDKSAAVRQLYSVSIGYTGRFCSSKELSAFMADPLKTLYLSGLVSDDENAVSSRLAVALVLGDLSKHSGDALQDIKKDFLPLVYLGAKDSDKQVRESFESVWESNTGGSSVAIRLYLNEMLSLLEPLITDSPSFAVKAQAGNVLSAIASSTGFSSDTISRVVGLLLASLKGRTWSGKSALLDALASLSISNASYFAEINTEELCAVFFREMKKQRKDSYKEATIRAVGLWFSHLSIKEEDYVLVYEYLSRFLQPKEAKTDGEMDTDSDSEDEQTSLAIRDSSISTLAQCLLNAKFEAKLKFLLQFLALLSQNHSIFVSYQSQKQVLASLELLADYCSKSADRVILESYATVLGIMYKPSNSFGQIRQDAIVLLKKVLSTQSKETLRLLQPSVKPSLEESESTDNLAFVRSISKDILVLMIV